MTDTEDGDARKGPLERALDTLSGTTAVGTGSLDTTEMTVGTGSDPVDVFVDADDLSGLVSVLNGGGKAFADEFRLQTNVGELVFEADGDRLIVTHDREEDSE